MNNNVSKKLDHFRALEKTREQFHISTIKKQFPAAGNLLVKLCKEIRQKLFKCYSLELGYFDLVVAMIKKNLNKLLEFEKRNKFYDFCVCFR